MALKITNNIYLNFILLDANLGNDQTLKFDWINTAFVQYVNVHKDEQLSWKGQLCLLLYVACHIVSRITATCALFATPEEFELPEDNPVMPHYVAGIIGILLLLGQIVLIYIYKHRKIREFKEASISERVVHVLTNTLVVIPFRPSLKIHDKKIQNKISSSEIEKNSDETNKENITSPDCKRNLYEKVTLQRKLEPFEEKIEEYWWKDPTRELTIEDIRIQLENEEDIEKDRQEDYDKIAIATYEYLTENGYINKKLNNPRQTKEEYVWLLSIHVSIHFVSLAIEFLNGGISTQKGIYVSWDIRLISFFLGLFFLRCYYSYFNIIKSRRPPTSLLNRLKNIGNILCLKEEKYVTQAIPNDLVLQNFEEVDCSGLHVPARVCYETQTSINLQIKKENLDKIAYIDEESGGYILIAQPNSRPLSPTQKDNQDLNNENNKS